jgi:guanosine-3',5'-bis(diphosphate) 3'-pyrophosphohydrolase
VVDPVKLLSALAFAADKHRDARRKDAAATPYVNHVIAVATVLATEGDVHDEPLLIASVLHDTVEDTPTSFEELELHFGREVRDLVAEVTDDAKLDEQTRKDLQIVQAHHVSAKARQIKIADKVSNVRDITNTPPADWPLERKVAYLDWAEQVVAGCRGVNPRLDAAFDHAMSQARATL